MTDPISEPTAAQKTEPVTEPTAIVPDAKTLTQAEIDAIVEARLDRERKKFADYKDLKAKAAKLDEYEKAKLSDEEKAAKRLKELEDKIAEKDKILQEKEFHNLKRSKLEQAIADGKLELPKGRTIDSLVKRMIGETEEDLDTDIEDLAGLFPKSKSLSGPSQTTQQPQNKPKDIDEQILEVQTLLAKSTDPQEIERLAERSILLKLKKQGHIKGD
jgi:hypothetical protein